MKQVIALVGRNQDGSKDTNYGAYPWVKGELILFMGEIEDMPGHGVYCCDHKIYYGYHIFDFLDLNSQKYIDLFPDGLDSVLIKYRDKETDRLVHLLEDKNLKKIENYNLKSYEDENNVVTHMFIHKNIIDFLKAPKMYAKDTETLEALFIYSLHLINSKFVYQELPLIKKRYNLLSTKTFSDVYQSFDEIIPIFNDILKELEIYDDYL